MTLLSIDDGYTYNVLHPFCRPLAKVKTRMNVDNILELMREVDPKEYEKYARHYGITDFRQLLSRHTEKKSVKSRDNS